MIQRDLIGMAYEQNLRGSSLNKSIGMDIKKFTHEIIYNSGGPSKIEIVLNFLLKLSGYFFWWFTLLAIGAYGSLSWEANPIIYVFFVGVVLLSFITEGILAPLFITERGIKKNLHVLISFFLFIIFTFIIFKLNNKDFTYEIKGWLIISVSSLLYIIIKYLNSKNISNLAKDKKILLMI